MAQTATCRFLHLASVLSVSCVAFLLFKVCRADFVCPSRCSETLKADDTDDVDIFKKKIMWERSKSNLTTGAMYFVYSTDDATINELRLSITSLFFATSNSIGVTVLTIADDMASILRRRLEVPSVVVDTLRLPAIPQGCDQQLWQKLTSTCTNFSQHGEPHQRECWNNKQLAKAYAFSKTPYDLTFMLDTDVVFNPLIFQKVKFPPAKFQAFAKRFDIVGAHPHCYDEPLCGLRAFKYNSGVLLYKNNPAFQAFLRVWMCMMTTTGFRIQYSLSLTLLATSQYFSPGWFPMQWNCRGDVAGSDEMKIVYGPDRLKTIGTSSLCILVHAHTVLKNFNASSFI